MILDYQTLLKSSLCPNLPEHRVVKLLKEISENFTISRDNIDLYTKSDDFVTAYSLFYLPTNFPKLDFVLDSLSEEIRDNLKKTSLIDMGCGPGTYSLAWRSYFEHSLDSEFYLIDQSKNMLLQAEQYFKRFFSGELNLNFSSSFPRHSTGPKTILFGNSFNEIGRDRCLEIVNQLDPEYLFFIEPGTSEVFNELMSFRDMIMDRYTNLYPCMEGNPRCPLIEKRKIGEEDWCHQVLRMTHDPSIERLSQLIGRDRKTMPMLAQLYGKKNLSAGPSSGARFVRFLNENKHAFNWLTCLKEDESTLVRFEIPKKFMDKKSVKEFKSLSVGLRVDYEIVKILSKNEYRVKVFL